MPLAGAQPSSSSGVARFLLGGIPLWIGIVAFLSVAAIVLVGLFWRREWATVAVVASVDAAVGAGLILIAAVVILLVRHAQWLTLSLSALLILVLGLGSVAALKNQPAFHQLQGQNLENSKHWASAITQYSRAGEEPPHAPDIARVRLEWGEEFLGRDVYDLAVDQFYQALEDDGSSAIADRANGDLYQLYAAWLQAGPPEDILHALSSFLDRYIQSSQCDSACRQATRPLAAQALYLYAGLVLKQNPKYCDPAIAEYRDVASRYADTVSGQKAAADLAGPVTYTVFIRDIPNPKGLHAWLSKTIAPYQPDYVTYFSKEYATTLDASGTAVFHNVAPGDYNFMVLLPDGERDTWRYVSPFNPYTEVILPLCGGSDTLIFDS
jgi:hypothetical protein